MRFVRGTVRNRWTIAGLGGLFLGSGAVFGMSIPIDISSPSVNAAPEQPIAFQRASQVIPQALPQVLPQPQLSQADRRIFKSLLTRAKQENWEQLELGTLTQVVGQSFLGREYKANLLDRAPSLANGHETLLASLQQFDCVLFVETVLALAQTIRQPDLSEAQAEQLFFSALQQHRYRHGQLDDYCSRLHYFSDWILDNQRRGLVQEMGRSLDGKPLVRSLSFMSQNWNKYPVLVAHPKFKKCIANVEAEVSSKDVFYIPTQQISQYYSKVQPGDVIGVVTNIEELDVTHSGFVYQPPSQQINQRLNQRLNSPSTPQIPKTGLMHASLRSGIKISPDLARYVAGVDGAIGIVIARPQPFALKALK